jgi:acyl-CoA thioesterase YciA
MNSYRKLVMPEDLNPAGKLFGGKILAWTDEAAALYAMCQLKTRHLVTLKFSESVFKQPISCGDFLEFSCWVIKFGTTSLTVGVNVETKDISPGEERKMVFTAEVVLVSIDENGKPKSHGVKEVRK